MDIAQGAEQLPSLVIHLDVLLSVQNIPGKDLEFLSERGKLWRPIPTAQKVGFFVGIPREIIELKLAVLGG